MLPDLSCHDCHDIYPRAVKHPKQNNNGKDFEGECSHEPAAPSPPVVVQILVSSVLIFCAMLFGGIYCLIRNICRRMKEQQAMIDAGMQHGGYGAGGMGQRGYAAEEVDSGVGYSVAVSNRLFKEWTSERMDIDYM